MRTLRHPLKNIKRNTLWKTYDNLDKMKVPFPLQLKHELSLRKFPYRLSEYNFEQKEKKST